MTTNFAQTPDQVQRAVDTVIQNRPAYADMLNFYGRLFEAQEQSKSRLRIEPLQISDEMRAVKAREKFPLIEIKEFVHDQAECADLFVTSANLPQKPTPNWRTRPQRFSKHSTQN